MTSLADQVIAALRSGFDDLAAYAGKLTGTDLTGPSAATEWNVAQVLSHLGSGAEIHQAALDRALAGGGAVPDGFNQGVWARWDVMSPVEQRDAFITANRSLVGRYESLDEAARRDLRIDLGFLPAAIGVAEAGQLRLNEFALHAWDVRAGSDPAATVAAEAVPLLLDPVKLLLGWIAKPDTLGGKAGVLAVRLSAPDRAFGLAVGEQVSIVDTPADPDGVVCVPAEAWLRLITGRLRPSSTPADVEVTGLLTLDELRALFPGF